MVAQPTEGAEDKSKKKAVPDMGRGSREQMFRPQKPSTRKPAPKSSG